MGTSAAGFTGLVASSLRDSDRDREGKYSSERGARSGTLSCCSDVAAVETVGNGSEEILELVVLSIAQVLSAADESGDSDDDEG